MDQDEKIRRERARAVAAEVVGNGDVDPDSIPLEPLAGMTNRNYKVSIGGKNYVVRIPGEGTEEYVDRKADFQAATLTSRIGTNAPLIHYDVEAGIQITQYLDGCRNLRDPGVLDDMEVVRRTGRAFKHLHSCGEKFLNRFHEKNVAAEYMDLLKSMSFGLPDGYEGVQEEAESIRDLLDKTCKALVPCHNDPAPENLVDMGDRVHILDWEFGGNNDAFWDLGDFSVESDFSPEQDAVFLEAYLGRAPTEAERARLILQKSMVFLLWTLWGLLQEANKNPTPAYEFASYWDYGMDRFTRCQEIMNSDEFPALMEAVRKDG